MNHDSVAMTTPTWANLCFDRGLAGETLLDAVAAFHTHDLVQARLKCDVGTSLIAHTALRAVRLKELSETKNNTSLLNIFKLHVSDE